MIYSGYSLALLPKMMWIQVATRATEYYFVRLTFGPKVLNSDMILFP